jgi:PKD repeat protein
MFTRFSLLTRLVTAFLFLLALPSFAPAAPSFDPATPWNAVPTFHSLGLYWAPTGKAANVKAAVRFRASGTSQWQEGLDLWYDSRNGEYRGSLVHLQPATTYEIQLKLGNGAWTNVAPAVSCSSAANAECNIPPSATCTPASTQCTRTWSEDFPVAHTVHLPPAPGPNADQQISHIVISPKFISAPESSLDGRILTINVPVEPGAGYTLITHAEGGNKVVDSTGAPAVLPDNGATTGFETQIDSCILVEPGVPQVIIRGLEVKNCKRHGIFLWRACSLHGNAGTCQQAHNAYFNKYSVRPQTRDIVIDDNKVSMWGGFGSYTAGIPDKDGGVSCNYGSFGVWPDRVIIQRNTIFNPRYSATSWSPHPEGGNGIWSEFCGRSFVIRYNDITGVSLEAPYQSTVTITTGSPSFVNWTNHGLAEDTPVMFGTTGALPGLKTNTIYFVAQPEANRFRLSATRTGAAINLSGSQSGTHTATMHKYLMDGMGGSSNFNSTGFLWADSDVYQNRITHVFDDGIESEGGNRNVRIWGNFMDRIFVPIGNAPVVTGPLYVWRNISNVVGGLREGADPDAADRQPFVKAGGPSCNGSNNGGRAYYFHNTALQPDIGETQKGGVGWGIGNWVGNGSLYNFVSHNNLWQNHDPNDDDFAVIDANPDCSGFDTSLHETTVVVANDLYNTNQPPFQPATLGNPNATGLQGTPVYASPNTVPSPSSASGDFRLASGSPGRGQAIALNNFNAGLGSDIGAHQSGTGTVPMVFGRAAAGDVQPPNAVLNLQPTSGSGQAPLQVTFDASQSTPGTFPIASLRLEFGHGSPPDVTWTDKNTTQQHIYPAGTYTARLTVSDDRNPPNTRTVERQITAQCSAAVRPTASFTANPTSGDAPLAVTFNAAASTAVSPATITSYTITYGDGGSGSGVNQSHTYNTAGTHVASLVVRDSNNCDSDPATHNITVGSGGGPVVTKTLMEGLEGYAGTTDAHLWSGQPNTNRDLVLSLRTESDASCTWCDSGVIRFAIFQSEGGPVPDGATILEATLSLYQFSGPDAVIKASRLLKSFHEQQVTWNVAASGSAWTTPGANSAGSDYVAAADGQGQSPNADALTCTSPADPSTCWLNINVTSGVQAFAGGAANHGWKLAQVSSSIPGNFKNFNTSENDKFPAYRPKLTVRYTTAPPQSVTLMQDQGGYTGTTDAALREAAPTTNLDTSFQVRGESTDSSVIRFAIFAAEGGPVPNGATITSATLSLYQFGGPPAVLKASRLLKSFHEQQVTWNLAAAGTPWSSAGANGAGTDYLAAADGQAQGPDAETLNCDGPPLDPNQCWVHINVTSGVQAFAGGTANRGWKIAQVSSPVPGNYKNFNASENPGFPNYRPKLTIQYVGP